jgi:hypothetical protein
MHFIDTMKIQPPPRSNISPQTTSADTRQRSHSTSRPDTQKLAPEVRKFDTLEHPLSGLSPRNPGTLMVARNNQNEWNRIPCTPNSLLQNIEVRARKGLLNLTGSAQFATGELNQTQKRDLQRAVTTVVMSYNALAAKSGTPALSIHENHLIGDGEVHEDRKIPRKSNERDYDYYHTLGANFTDNGRMLPHYHLEFGGPLNRGDVAAVLESLHRIGKEVLGQEILSTSDITAVLAKVPKGASRSGITAQDIETHRLPLPNELESPERRAHARDELEGAFIGLSSRNTELGVEQPLIRNMHMNSFRQAEPMFECFSSGHTSVMDDLLKIEAHPISSRNPSPDVGELLAINQGLRKASRELAGYSGGNIDERQALDGRLNDAMSKIKHLLNPDRKHLAAG